MISSGKSIGSAIFAAFVGFGALGSGPAMAQEEARSCQALVEALAEQGHVALSGVNFDFNRASLRPDSTPALIAARDAILTLGGDWRIEGHTDNRGDHAYSQALSEARALAVRDWLTAAGVAPGQLSAQGFSFDRPVADNATDMGRAQNRRVELVGSVDRDMLGFGGPEGVDPCPDTLMPGTRAEAEAAPIAEWTGSGGQEWLPFSYIMPTASGGAQGWVGDRITMPPGTQPQACQALCLAERQCGAFSFEPAGSFFVETARCALIGYGTEMTLKRDNTYFAGGSIFASGLKPDARLLTPESEAIAQEILDDMAEIAGLRASLRILAPKSHTPEAWMDVSLEGVALPEGYPSYIEIADLGDYVFDGWASKSHIYVHDMPNGRSGQIWVPEPGDYVLRYVIDHPTAGRHSILEMPFSASAQAGTAMAPGPQPAAADGQASLSFPMVVTPGEVFTITYSGPLLSGDWIDMITPGNDADMSGGWGWEWATGGPIALTAPAQAGEYVLRYVAEDPARGRTVLAAEPLVVRAQAPVSVDTSDIVYRCEGSGFEPCEIRDAGNDLVFNLMPGYGTTAPLRYRTAAGVEAARPGFEMVRLSDGAYIASVNPPQIADANCLPAGLDTICVIGASTEMDQLASFALVGSLGTLTAFETAGMGEDGDLAEPGDLQGVWVMRVFAPGTVENDRSFAVVELIQDAGDPSADGSFTISPDFAPLASASGNATASLAGDWLNLALDAGDGQGLVFGAASYGEGAYKGDVHLAGQPGAGSGEAILFRVAGPGEDWRGEPWMHGEVDGMEAAMQMSRQVMGELLGDAAPEDRAMLEALGQMLGVGAGGGQPGGQAAPSQISPQMQALGGVPLEGLTAEEALVLFLPHLETRP